MDIKLPELGENIAQGTLSKVLVKVGDSVKKGQNILELETDKAVLEVPSPSDGVIKEILVNAGQIIKVGQPVFKFDGPGAPIAVTITPASKATTAAPTSMAAEKQAAPIATPVATGAIVEMKLPELGENIAQGTVTKILVKVGDYVQKGQSIAELETDKAVLEVPSSMEGAIEEILLKTGQVAKVGQLAFKIKSSGGAAVGAGSPRPQQGQGNPAPTAVETPAVSETAAPVPGFIQQPAKPAKPAKDIAAAPSVRRFAREIGIDITTIPGSGPGGRISVEDIKAFAKKILTSLTAGGGSTIGMKSAPLPDFQKWGQTERQPMNNVRRKTAEHLGSAWVTIPHVTQFDKANVTELEKLRKKLSTPEKKLSITPFLIKVIASALKQFPQFNSSIDMSTNEIILKKYINVGVAVDTDRGLLVPVLKNVDQMSVEQISDALSTVAQRARDRKITLDDLQGGSFTLSNLGGIGGTFFTPIVNWPEVAILGASRGVMEPVYIDGQFLPRLLLPLSLSYDHRIIDGADGARFIRWVCTAIEDPNSIK